MEGFEGQQLIREILQSAYLNDKIGHAYIFDGPKGIGKKTLAIDFARVLLCTEKDSFEYCNNCNSCKLYEDRSHPELKIVETTKASIGVEAIREIQNILSIRPVYSEKKIIIIPDAQKMTVEAQNCLLKSLEEPPQYAVIILTVENASALLETVRSRSQRYTLKRWDKSLIELKLKEKGHNNIDSFDFIISYCDGIIGSALELVSSEEFLEIREKTFNIALDARKFSMEEIISSVSFFESKKENINTILDIMLFTYRDLLFARQTGDQNILINSDKKDIINNNVQKYDTADLIKSVRIVEETRRALGQNANFSLAVEVMLLKLQEEN